MKKIIVIIALIIQVTACLSIDLYCGGSAQVRINDRAKGIAFGIMADVPMNRYVDLGISLDLSHGRENTHNLLYCSSIRLDRILDLENWVLKARGAFGWGHHYTNAVTDHNYHTYQVGILIERRICKDYLVYLLPSINCRTYAEHIGYSKDRAWIQLQCGFSFDL